MIEETKKRNELAAKEYEANEVPETEDIDELNSIVKEMTAQLSELESKILEADMNDDSEAKSKLKDEADKLRSRRDNTVMKIKALKNEGARSASASGVSMEFQNRIKTLEEQNNSLRVQIASLRNEMFDLRDSVAQIMNRLGIERRE